MAAEEQEEEEETRYCFGLAARGARQEPGSSSGCNFRAQPGSYVRSDEATGQDKISIKCNKGYQQRRN
jgi:hypothetical protein